MKKLFIILLSVVAMSALAQQKPKIAVYMTGDDPVNEIVSNRLVDDFARGNEYTTVERTASFLAELSKEHAYERSGEVDDEQIAALGRQFNVQYVCVVSVLDVWNTEKYITARIIDTKTAEVIASCSSNGSIQNSSELIGALNTLSESFFKAMRSSKQDNAKKVAVYVSKTGNRDVDIVLGDQLVSGFAKSGRYLAIERTSGFLKKLKEEQGYQQSGAVADDDLTRWGKQFGVQYICVTKTTSWTGDYFITTRMVDVKTGEVVNSYKVEGRKLNSSRDVIKVAQEIATELSKGTLAEQAEAARLKRFQFEEKIRPIETQLKQGFLQVKRWYVTYPLGYPPHDNNSIYHSEAERKTYTFWHGTSTEKSVHEITESCNIGNIVNWRLPSAYEIHEIKQALIDMYCDIYVQSGSCDCHDWDRVVKELENFSKYGSGYRFWTKDGNMSDGYSEKINDWKANYGMFLMLVCEGE